MSTQSEGEKYGKRLYHVASVRDYIAAQEAFENALRAVGAAENVKEVKR